MAQPLRRNARRVVGLGARGENHRVANHAARSEDEAEAWAGRLNNLLVAEHNDDPNHRHGQRIAKCTERNKRSAQPLVDVKDFDACGAIVDNEERPRRYAIAVWQLKVKRDRRVEPSRHAEHELVAAGRSEHLNAVVRRGTVDEISVVPSHKICAAGRRGVRRAHHRDGDFGLRTRRLRYGPGCIVERERDGGKRVPLVHDWWNLADGPKSRARGRHLATGEPRNIARAIRNVTNARGEVRGRGNEECATVVRRVATKAYRRSKRRRSESRQFHVHATTGRRRAVSLYARAGERERSGRLNRVGRARYERYRASAPVRRISAEETSVADTCHAAHKHREASVGRLGLRITRGIPGERAVAVARCVRERQAEAAQSMRLRTCRNMKRARRRFARVGVSAIGRKASGGLGVDATTSASGVVGYVGLVDGARHATVNAHAAARGPSPVGRDGSGGHGRTNAVLKRDATTAGHSAVQRDGAVAHKENGAVLHVHTASSSRAIARHRHVRQAHGGRTAAAKGAAVRIRTTLQNGTVLNDQLCAARGAHRTARLARRLMRDVRVQQSGLRAILKRKKAAAFSSLVHIGQGILNNNLRVQACEHDASK
eukprot:Opistho-1_new@17706